MDFPWFAPEDSERDQAHTVSLHGPGQPRRVIIRPGVSVAVRDRIPSSGGPVATVGVPGGQGIRWVSAPALLTVRVRFAELGKGRRWPSVRPSPAPRITPMEARLSVD
ncbi:hypothetical protein ATKI12_0458 [Kitasatospora sp. Ki12]